MSLELALRRLELVRRGSPTENEEPLLSQFRDILTFLLGVPPAMPLRAVAGLFKNPGTAYLCPKCVRRLDGPGSVDSLCRGCGKFPWPAPGVLTVPSCRLANPPGAYPVPPEVVAEGLSEVACYLATAEEMFLLGAQTGYTDWSL